MTERVSLRVNGEVYEIQVTPKQLLLDALRDDLGLTGARRGCEDNVCGACTVLLDGMAVHSCTVLAVRGAGRDILTIEGLAKDGKLHPIQEAFVREGAIQCGYCTPGMILAAKTLLDANPEPTEPEVRAHLTGNLCRCTGYEKIVRAILMAARSSPGSGSPLAEG
jgi:carbon-monoxide dehydrogenase small subunit